MRLFSLLAAAGVATICVLTFSQQTRPMHPMADDRRVGAGRVAWQFETGRLSVFNPYGRGDTLLIGSCAGTFYAFEKRTATERRLHKSCSHLSVLHGEH